MTQKHDDIQPMGPEEFKEVTMVMGKDARKLHRMGILTGERGREGERESTIIFLGKHL